MTDVITTRREGAILEVTLDRPKANAIDVATSRALYTELFPDDRRIVNLRAQFDEHIGQRSGASSGFMRLLDKVAQAMAEGIPVSISQLDYNEARGDLALQVRASDFATLEQLRQRLSESGESVQMGSASRDGDMVSARVVIGGSA